MHREVQIVRSWLNSCRVSQSLGSCVAIRSDGIPDIVTSDNRLQFTTEWGFEHLPPLEEGDVVRMRPFAPNGKPWEKASGSKRLDERVDLRKIQGANQEEITRHEVNPRNDCPEPQTARHPSLKPHVQLQESHALQPPISPPHIKKTELGTPKKPPSQSSLPTKLRPKRAVREPTYLKDYIRK